MQWIRSDLVNTVTALRIRTDAVDTVSALRIRLPACAVYLLSNYACPLRRCAAAVAAPLLSLRRCAAACRCAAAPLRRCAAAPLRRCCRDAVDTCARRPPPAVGVYPPARGRGDDFKYPEHMIEGSNRYAGSNQYALFPQIAPGLPPVHLCPTL